MSKITRNKYSLAGVVVFLSLRLLSLTAAPAFAQNPAAAAPLVRNFASSIPLLILERAEAPADSGTKLFLSQDDQIEISLVDNAEGLNRPGDRPASTWTALARGEANSVGGGKTGLQLTAASEGWNWSPPNLPASSKWTLLGSGRDRAMLRHYLAQLLARELWPGQFPQAVFCEVLIKSNRTPTDAEAAPDPARPGSAEGGLALVEDRGQVYFYHGLYLLSEYLDDGVWDSPEIPPDRRFLARLALTGDETAASGAGALHYLPPAAGRKPAKVEQRLNSNDNRAFFSARSEMDSRSFVETFLLIQMMMNLPAGEMPFYFVQGDGEHLSVSPLWRFEVSLDNAEWPLDALVTAENRRASAARVIQAENTPWAQSDGIVRVEAQAPGLFEDIFRRRAQEPITAYPWFDRLLEDVDFITDLRSLFFKLDRGAWNIEELERAIDRLARDLQPALERDWQRWGSVYEAAAPMNMLLDNGDDRIRATSGPVEEIIRIKSLLRSNNLALKEMMFELRWREIQFTESKKTVKGLALTVCFMAVFFLVVGYVRRRM